MKPTDIERLRKKAYELRRTVLDMCVRAGTGHVTSSFSCLDILVALYHGGVLRVDPQNPDAPGRDRFVLSKGQASPALYAVLADRGFFPKEHLKRFAQAGGRFGVHLQHDVPGAEITSGSLGHGLGIAAGLALAARMDRELYLTFALLGDGECHEGSVWESALFAGHHRLNNLVAIVDRNYLCVTDFVENLLSIEPLEEKFAAFGWETLRVDGHDFDQLADALSHVRSRRRLKPLAILADTVKGEGAHCLTDDPAWHGLAPSGEMAERAMQCLIERYEDG